MGRRRLPGSGKAPGERGLGTWTGGRGDAARQAPPCWTSRAPEEAEEKHKASIRAKVEHPFLYVKRHFGYSKVRYRGLAKNTQRIAMLLGFTNLLIAGRYAAT